MLNAFLKKKWQAGNPGSRLLSNAFYRKREARAFPPAPSEDFVRASRPHTVFLAAPAGYSSGQGGRKLNPIIDALI
jgi:hypothetical protein